MSVSVDAVRRHLAARESATRAVADELASRHREALPRLAAILRRHGAGRVVLFGSLANGRTTPESDVDLACEGLPLEVYFAALDELMRRLPGRVDLVRLEEASASLRERIAVEGEEL